MSSPCELCLITYTPTLVLIIILNVNRSIIGELDEDLDAHIELSQLRGHPLKPVIH